MSIQPLGVPLPVVPGSAGNAALTRETDRRSPDDRGPAAIRDTLALNAATEDVLPHYPTLFGPAAYVRSGQDPNLLRVATKLIAQAPELQDKPLAFHVHAGHLDREDVRTVQRFLEGKGFSLGAPGVDGLYGPLSHQALKAYLEAASASRPLVARADPTPPSEPEPGPLVATTVVPLRPLPVEMPPAIVPVQRPQAAGSDLPLPPRPADAPSGSAFIAQIRGLSGSAREQAVLEEILRGNVPDFLRQFKTLPLTFTDARGQVHQGDVRVLPDYLAIGSNQDFVRIPMSPLAAQRLADMLGCSLPTRKLVDAIYRQADVRVPPSPLPADPQMTSLAYALRHQQQIDRQLAGAAPGPLMAGHKKDVVVSTRLEQHPGRVAIYGWHQPNGKPIQGLSTVHEASYADYSHGIRLVAGTMSVDGVERPIADVLRDPLLAGLLSDEGVMRNPRYSTR